MSKNGYEDCIVFSLSTFQIFTGEYPVKNQKNIPRLFDAKIHLRITCFVLNGIDKTTGANKKKYRKFLF